MEEIKFGIEQELIFKNDKNEILDFSNSKYSQFKKIVDEFPFYEGDEEYFYLKSTETKPKRCYIEGFELHDEEGNIIETIPKGLEIRTTPHSNIQDLIEELENSFSLLKNLTEKENIYPIFISYHPFKTKFNLPEKVLEHEKKFRTEKELKIAMESMFTFGMHVSLSNNNWNKDILNKYVEKLNYYLPFIIPFSFSSPFLKGREFEGYCYRNYVRANYVKLVEIRKKNNQFYIEFKAFDVVKDKELLKGLIYLIKGIIIEETLKGRLKKKDVNLIKSINN